MTITQDWLMVGIFAIIQIGALIKTFSRLHKTKSLLWGSKWESIKDKNNPEITLIKQGSGKSERDQLVSEINDYITVKQGAIDFDVLKDKVERTVEAKYSWATSLISFPTLLGLLGTFAGVAIGLWDFRSGVVSAGNGGISDAAVGELIGGIIVAMVTSVVGLLLYLIGNALAAKARKELDAEEDEFLCFLQEEIVPELGNDVSASLNNLNLTIKSFKSDFSGVVGDFKKAVGDCTEMFKGNFNDNVKVLTEAVSKMGSNMALVNENIEKQDRLLATLQQPGTLHTLESFVNAAESFKFATATIQELESLRTKIEESTQALVARQQEYNTSLEIPSTLLSKINDLLNRVSTFEESINNLGRDIKEIDSIDNSLINKIEEQLSALKIKQNMIERYQDDSVGELNKIYKADSEAINNMAMAFRRDISDNQAATEKALKDFSEKYSSLVAACIRQINEKMQELFETVDKLTVENSLSNLNRLPAIQTSLEDIRRESPDKSGVNEIRNAVLEGNQSLERLVSHRSQRSKSSQPRRQNFLSRLFPNAKKRAR